MSESTSIKPSEETRIVDGSKVDLHFSVTLEDVGEVDNTRSRTEPVSLTMGDGSLLEGFEKALLGLRAGDRRTVHLPPEEAFGPWNPDNVQHFDRILWAKTNDTPVVGMMMEFTDKGGGTLPGVITDINEETVTVDFNHPLAGKNIVFEVEIFKVTPPGVQSLQLK